MMKKPTDKTELSAMAELTPKAITYNSDDKATSSIEKTRAAKVENENSVELPWRRWAEIRTGVDEERFAKNMVETAMIILHHKLFDVDEIPLTLLISGKKIKVAAKKHLPVGALKIPLFFKHQYSMVMAIRK